MCFPSVPSFPKPSACSERSPPMKYLFTRIVNSLALCLLFCLLAACQQDPTIVEIVYVQEEADAKPQAPSQARPEVNAADANTPGSALSPSSEEPAPAPEETKNPLLDIQIPTPSFLPFPTPSPMPTPTLFPTPTPAVRTPAPTTPPPTTTPAATPVPEPTISQNNDLERERLAAAYAQEVESISVNTIAKPPTCKACYPAWRQAWPPTRNMPPRSSRRFSRSNPSSSRWKPSGPRSCKPPR